jgi:ABC-type multidrug transport system ATPase subunit
MRIEARDLVVLRGAHRAVDGAGLVVESGSWLGLVGANGGGKTSLLRALAGRLDVAAGRILLDGEDRTADRAWRARAVGFAPEPSSLPETLSGRELFSIIAPDAPGLDAGDPLRRVRAALDFETFLDRRIGTLSAGMRQRLAIFCAFLTRPRAVILDEPFNWLDPICAFDTREALGALVAGEGLTLVTALHEMATLIGYCVCGLLLSEGRVGLALGPQDILNGARDYAAFEAGIIASLRSPARRS